MSEDENKTVAEEYTTEETYTAELITTTQPRWKSWALWASVLGAIGLVLQATGAMEAMGLTSDAWNGVVTALGTILTTFGLVNNPTNHDYL